MIGHTHYTVSNVNRPSASLDRTASGSCFEVVQIYQSLPHRNADVFNPQRRPCGKLKSHVIIKLTILNKRSGKVRRRGTSSYFRTIRKMVVKQIVCLPLNANCMKEAIVQHLQLVQKIFLRIRMESDA
jgi:hypothetical protein